jgi:uncharacterized membrane protein
MGLMPMEQPDHSKPDPTPTGAGSPAQPFQSESEEGMLAAAYASAFSGPLPPPQLLEQYNTISPALTARILKLAETEVAHRRTVELKIVDARIEDVRADRRQTRFGQLLGFLACTTAIIAGSITAVKGAALTGAFIGGGGIAGLASAFIYTHRHAEGNKGKGNVSEDEK